MRDINSSESIALTSATGYDRYLALILPNISKDVLVISEELLT